MIGNAFPILKEHCKGDFTQERSIWWFGGTLELGHHSILASAFKEIIGCCDLNIGNKTVRMTGELAAALCGGLFSHTCFYLSPSFPRQRECRASQTGHGGSQKWSIIKDMLFYPETLNIRKFWFGLELCCVLGVWMLAAETSWESLLFISGTSHPLSHSRKFIR